MNQFYHVDIVIVLVLFSTFQWNYVSSQNLSEGCRTPDNRNGKCIPILSCQPLIDLLRKERPPSPAIINFLRESQCGFSGRDPLVCCPNPEIFPEEEEEEEEDKLPDGEREPVDEEEEEDEDEDEDEVPDTNTSTGSHSGTTIKDVSKHPGVKNLLPEFCGPVIDEKITRGDNASLYQFPWMALLGYASKSGIIQYRCGGSLINKRYILTAAHCVTHLNDLQLVQVRLGEYDLLSEIDCEVDKGCAPPVQDFRVEQAIPHPKYVKEELKNDIALIRLTEDANFMSSVRPICLPVGRVQQSKTLEGEKVTVTGWGSTEFGTTSSILLKVHVPVIPLDKCAAIYEKSVPVTERQLCAGGTEGKDSCSGDSGGPLQFVGQPVDGGLSYIQYGVVSFGPRHCGSKGKPGVYTRVGYYMDWILDTMRP